MKDTQIELAPTADLDDGDLRHEVEALMVHLGYPELRLSAAEVIPSGEEYWMKFLSRASEERLEKALVALQGLEV